MYLALHLAISELHQKVGARKHSVEFWHMDHWLLLALVYSLGFTILILSPVGKKHSTAALTFGVGFACLTASLALEIVLRFELQDWAARGFYWARSTLTLAWLGLGAVMSVWPGKRYWRWAVWSLAATSLLALAMLALTPLTRAEDWFTPSAPVYGQLGDLLATNRPIRWSALLLNLVGATALAGGVLYSFIVNKDRSWTAMVRTGCLVAGAILLFFPIYWPPTEANALFILIEALPPLLLFAGFSGVVAQEAGPRRKKAHVR